MSFIFNQHAISQAEHRVAGAAPAGGIGYKDAGFYQRFDIAPSRVRRTPREHGVLGSGELARKAD